MMQPAAEKPSGTGTDAGDGDEACLPYDVLLDILRRLPCRAIAQCRTICRAWRAVVDGSGLLPRFFSSRSFPGVFFNHTGCGDKSYFLAAPASGSRAGDFRRPLFCHGWARVLDHCNGLLLLHNKSVRLSGQRELHDIYVCNPVTIRCDALPRPRCSSMYEGWEGTFLAFDPAVSLHYEVYEVLGDGKSYYRSPGIEVSKKETVVRSRVYSSQTRQWKMRFFARAGNCTTEHLYNVKARAQDMNCPSAEYWRGALYVPRRNGVLMILHCLEETYDLVQLPGEVYTTAGGTYHLPRRCLLASYEKGIHYAELSAFQLKVWVLAKGLGDNTLGWTLVHDVNLEPHVLSMQRFSGTTQSRIKCEMVESSKSNGLFRQKDDTTHGVDDEEVQEQETNDDGKKRVGNEVEEYSWNSDEDNYVDMDKSAPNNTSLKRISFCGIIGLHPYKDALLLNISGTAVAYHFNTSRMQYLCSRLHSDLVAPSCAITGAFPYRPCYEDMIATIKIPCPPSILNWWNQKHGVNYNI